MSNIIPPLVSDSPPPPPSEEDEDDEFDEFRGSNDISYNGCESFSVTPSPEQTPEKHEISSPNEHNPEFIFKPVSSVTDHRNIEHLPTNSFKSKENIVESRNHNVNACSIKPLKQNISEISCSQEHLDIATKVFQNNNITNKDNIPSQFIVESENAEHKIDDKCDTKNIIKGPNEILIDKNVVNDRQILDVLVETPKEFYITQNLESESFAPNARESIVKEVNSEILSSKDTGISKSKLNYQTAETPTSDRESKLEINEIDETPNITHFTEVKNSIDNDLAEDKEEKLISHKKYNHFDSETVFNWENSEFDSSNEDFDDNFQAFSSNTGEQLKSMSVNESEHTNIKEQNKDLDPHSTKYLKAELEYVTSNLNEQNIPIDDFANFSSFSANNVVTESLQKENIDISAFSKALGDHEAKNQKDFATFAAFGVQENDEDFDEFTSFPIDTIEKSVALTLQEFEDDFDDFGEFTSNTTDSSKSKPFLLLDEKESFKKTEEIIKDFFVPSEEVFEDFQYFELGKGDPIFTQLKDVTDTPAFGYHWSKSTSQKLFLKSLNIDSRNILYGHSWNSSVPRFAANLGVQPLEPVKMEPLNCTPTDLSPPTTQHSRTESLEVPSAQFDWTSSGLVNPLDYAPSDPTQSIKTESTAQTESDYEEFTSFQSSKPPTEWPSVPLRETYISDVPQAHIDIDVVLQPTIVTPELPRKSLSSENVTGFSENTIESKIDTKEIDDEEFDDFQMVYPVNKQLDKSDKNIEIKTELEKYNRKNVVVIEDSQDAFEIATTTKSPEPEAVTLENEEDFTEYHSSVPLPQLQPQSQPLPQFQPQSQPSSILEPILQPTPVYSTPSSTEINWPDPGISQDELKRFEAAFSLPMPQKKEEKSEPEKQHFQHKQSDKRSKEVQQKSTISIWDSPPKTYRNKVSEMKQPPMKIESKQNSLEEDEWSDFVSVQKPSPIHKTKFSDRTQNSSPDLTLSVLNLGSIQPAKQPIPVITPQGLVQTKLSANVNPAVQPKIVNPRPSYDLPSFQPSIISNQFASQAYNFGTASQSSQNNQNGQDDDEWGEFVSSPLPPQYQNSSTTVGHHGWNSFLPSNQSSSGHINQGLYANQTSGRSVNTNLQKKSNALSGLVLPELDFLALKERTGVSRKK